MSIILIGKSRLKSLEVKKSTAHNDTNDSFSIHLYCCHTRFVQDNTKFDNDCQEKKAHFWNPDVMKKDNERRMMDENVKTRLCKGVFSTVYILKPAIGGICLTKGCLVTGLIFITSESWQKSSESVFYWR